MVTASSTVAAAPLRSFACVVASPTYEAARKSLMPATRCGGVLQEKEEWWLEGVRREERQAAGGWILLVSRRSLLGDSKTGTTKIVSEEGVNIENDAEHIHEH